MEIIKVVGIGVNGDAVCSIFDSQMQKIVTNKGINIIAQEILRRYPEIAQKIVNADVIFEVDKITEINLVSLNPTTRCNLISEIVRISLK